MTDVQVLLCSSMGPKVEEQAEFLLRFVYHETLIGTLKSLECEAPKTTEFDNMMVDYKKHQVKFDHITVSLLLITVSFL